MPDPRDNLPIVLLARFRSLCAEPSDINQHLGTLWGLARQCEHVTEMGIRGGVSTTALLAAQPAYLFAFDVAPCPVVEELRGMCGRTVIHFAQVDSRKVWIHETELLHIDTIHAYSCLSVELQLHAPRVKKWIALHDTQTFGAVGDDGGAGMRQAINELLAGGKWRVFMQFPNNNGFTVLQRIAEE